MKGTIDISFLVTLFLTANNSFHKFSIEDVASICDQVQPIFEKESSLLEIQHPICICGDIHGQLNDLHRLLRTGGIPPKVKWLFLGDYVDRGENSLEVICFLFCLKIVYPNSVFLLRGNHENPEINRVFGFYSECQKKVDLDSWNRICKVFEYLPFAAVIDNVYFCVHGGLSPDLKTLDQIQKIRRPIQTPAFGLLADLLWSDPDPKIDEYNESPRKNTFVWGKVAAKRFLEENKLLGMFRAHQMVPAGYDYPFGVSLKIFTIFSAPDYDKEVHNNGAFLIVERPNHVDVKILHPVIRTLTKSNSQFKLFPDTKRDSSPKKKSRSNSFKLQNDSLSSSKTSLRSASPRANSPSFFSSSYSFKKPPALPIPSTKGKIPRPPSKPKQSIETKS